MYYVRDPVAWTASNRPVVIPLGTLKQAKMWKDHSFQTPDTTDGTYLTADDTVLDFGTRVGSWVTEPDESDVLTVTYTRDDGIPIRLTDVRTGRLWHAGRRGEQSHQSHHGDLFYTVQLRS